MWLQLEKEQDLWLCEGQAWPQRPQGSPGGWRRKDWRPTTCPPGTLGSAQTSSPCWGSSWQKWGVEAPALATLARLRGWAGSHSAPWR